MTRLRLRNRLRTLERRTRARLWGLLSQRVQVAGDVQIGRGCRLLLDPAARLTLDDGCTIDDGVTLAVYGDGRLHVGSGAFIGHHATVAAHRSIVIGAGTFLAELVSVRDHDHAVDAPPSSGRVDVDPVRIGTDVWLGAKSTVLRGAVIGDRSVVGANAVVRGQIPAGRVAVGVPARVVGSTDRRMAP